MNRDEFYEYFGSTEKIQNGKTFIGVPRRGDLAPLTSRTQRDTYAYSDSLPSQRRQSSATKGMSVKRTFESKLRRSQYREGGERGEWDEQHLRTERRREPSVMSTDELTHMNQESLTLLHEREDSLEVHDSAVHDLIINLDRAFEPPCSIYGDIQPDAELLPSQVTLLRLRRKRQDAAVARFCFQKAVTKYIMEWRTRMLRRYQALHCGRRAWQHYASRSFKTWQEGFKKLEFRNELSRRSMGLALAAILFKSFSSWRRREVRNQRVRTVIRKFSCSFCTWQRWQRAFRRYLTSSLVGMQADINVYDFLLRKHGRRVLNALHVKKPLINPRIVTRFARFQALKRGFSYIASRHMERAFKNGKLKCLAKLKKKNIFSQWRSFVRYCVTKTALQRKEQENTKKRLLTSAHQSCKLGLQKYVHIWKIKSKSQILLTKKLHLAKKFNYERAMMLAIGVWWGACQHGSLAQQRAKVVAIKHVQYQKIFQCFSQWRSQVACHVEDSTSTSSLHSQQHQSQQFIDYKRHYGRKCLLENVQQKGNFAISKGKLNMATALLLYTRMMWLRVFKATEIRKELHTWTRYNDRTALLFHIRNQQRVAMSTWIGYFNKLKQDKDNVYVADMQYCIVNMRSCFLRWQGAARLTVRLLQPAQDKATAHYFGKMSVQLLESLLRSGYLQRQQHKAVAHWRTEKCSAVLATLASLVNARRHGTRRLMVADPSLPARVASATRQDPSARAHKKKGQISTWNVHETVVCSRGRPSTSFFPLNNILLCSRDHEERRKRSRVLTDWVEFLVQRRAEQEHQQQTERVHHWPRLQLCGLRGLADYVTHRSQLKVHERKMDAFHDTTLLKYSLRQWRVYQVDSLRKKRVILQMHVVRGRLMASWCVSRWRGFTTDLKYFRDKEKASVPVFVNTCRTQLLRGLTATWQQGKLLRTAARGHSSRCCLTSLNKWQEWCRQQTWRRGLVRKAREHEKRWPWRLLKMRVRRYASNKRFCSTASSNAEHHKVAFRTRKGMRTMQLWASRRKHMKDSFATLAARRIMLNKRVIFNALVAYKIEGDAIVHKGKIHRNFMESKKAFHVIQEYMQRVLDQNNIIDVANEFYHRQLQKCFFVLYITNIKLPNEKQKRKGVRGASHHFVWCQRHLLLVWRRGLRSKRDAERRHGMVILRHKQSRGLHIFTSNVRKVRNRSLHTNKLVEVMSSRQKKIGLTQFASICRARMSAKIINSKAYRSFALRWKTKVMRWLKHLRHLRHASTLVRTSYSKWIFAIIRRRYLATVLGRRLVECTWRAVLKKTHMALREALSRWKEHLRQDALASRLVNLRADRMFRQAVSRWSKGSRKRETLRRHVDACVRAQQSLWGQKLIRSAFTHLVEQISRSQLEKRLERKCRRHLFRTFKKRIIEKTVGREKVWTRNHFADTYFIKSSLRLGFRYLMYRVQMKYHRRHIAYLETREYRRGLLRAAVRRLHRCARRTKQRRLRHGALQAHCAQQQKRRVLQLLDCAVARRWGKQQEQERDEREGGKQTKTLLLHRGFRRLLKHGQRKRHGRQQICEIVD